ncbi:hypothetical protein AB0I90_01960 [Micromonospora wenchangensis]|uniref:Uncharacterized protein n=1 Tax=Micromonospora wenchangensis TaxID=1185415 RepID=A0A246RSY7_9ACTN|nr:hypothetical protein [Micromonospora wenchangensis]OWV12858.1 hypothetical protein B5D80_01480 [Micromonospora wenchangensis]
MVDSHSTPARTRPGLVTLSSYLLMFFAVLQLIGLILTLAISGKLRQAFEDAFEGTASEVEGLGTAVVVFAVGASAVLLLIALALVVLAIFNNRGKNGSRIATWVVGGIMVCCVGGGLVNGAAGFSGSTGSTSGNAPSADELERSMNAVLPSWYNPVSTLLGVVSLLALLAALILLALPQSNEFFRKPKAGWEPPVPGAAYPAAPGYPPTPGYPATPDYPQPGAPGQPGTPGPSSTPGQPGPSSATPGVPDQPQSSDGPSWSPPSGGEPDRPTGGSGPDDPQRPAGS